MRRGEIWWAQLEDPTGSGPGFRRPVVVISANPFNRSGIDTVIVVAMTGNLLRAQAPGNVLVPRAKSGLPRDSVINVTQVTTLDKRELESQVGHLPPKYLALLDDGLRLVLALA